MYVQLWRKGSLNQLITGGGGPYCRVNKQFNGENPPFVDDFPALSPWP